MTEMLLSKDDIEALEEVFNLGMGKAGSALGDLLDTFVTLQVPEISLIDSSCLAAVIQGQIDSDRPFNMVRQEFFSNLHGEVFVVFELECCKTMAKMLGYGENETWADQEILLDVSNILSGACLNCVGEHLNTEFSFSPPSIVGQNLVIDELLLKLNPLWKHAIVTKIQLKIEQQAFSSNLLIFMSDESFEQLRLALNIFIESFE